MVTIKHMTRGHIELEHDGRTAVIQGEGLLRGHGSPDFVLYSNTLSHWASPQPSEPINDETRRMLLAGLLKALEDRGLTAEVE